ARPSSRPRRVSVRYVSCRYLLPCDPNPHCSRTLARSFTTRRRPGMWAAAGFDTARRAALKASPGVALSEGPRRGPESKPEGRTMLRFKTVRANSSGLHETQPYLEDSGTACHLDGGALLGGGALIGGVLTGPATAEGPVEADGVRVS